MYLDRIMLCTLRHTSGFNCRFMMPRNCVARVANGWASSGVPLMGKEMRMEQFLKVSSQPIIRRVEMGRFARTGASLSGCTAATASRVMIAPCSPCATIRLE